MFIDIHDVPSSLDAWKKILAEGIYKTAKAREESWTKPENVYGKSIEIAAVMECDDQEIARIVTRCLRHYWNESLDFAKEYGFDLVSKPKSNTDGS